MSFLGLQYLLLSFACDGSIGGTNIPVGCLKPGFHMCLKCLRHAPATIELNGASTVWDMSQACLRHIWKPGFICNIGNQTQIKVILDVSPGCISYLSSPHGLCNFDLYHHVTLWGGLIQDF